ncbi:hypothetical protein HJG60_009370 [Phyllostomus discolor]|uniref:Uncharacterized protein n=1 Tax=Phyllostomus discolor TaxID=89673 RepID=A0A833YKN4_9CHIR|nr:hypothetical protein HJG60_009370 [Phyllostomus discolor]
MKEEHRYGRDPRNPNSIITGAERRWLSAKETAFKRFLSSPASSSECSLFLSSSVGMASVSAGHRTAPDTVTPASVGPWPKSWGAPWTNRLFYKPGRWEGWSIFDNQTFQCNVFLRGHSPHSCYREKHQVCSFLFSYNKRALLTNITMAKNTV